MLKEEGRARAQAHSRPRFYPLQAARMLPSVIEHQIGYGTRVKPAQQPVSCIHPL